MLHHEIIRNQHFLLSLYYLYIDNKGLTENVDSELSHDEAKMLKEKLTQELESGSYINTTSLKIVTEFDFDQL